MSNKQDWNQLLEDLKVIILECKNMTELASRLLISKSTLRDGLKREFGFDGSFDDIKNQVMAYVKADDISKSTTDVKKQRDYYRTLSEQLQSTMETKNDFYDMVRQVVSTLPEIKPIQEKVSTSRKKRKAQSAVLILSDVQYGQVVDPKDVSGTSNPEIYDFLKYNTEVADKRLDFITDTTSRIVDDHRQFTDVDELVLVFLGDMIDHSTLRPEHSKFVEMNAIKQTFKLYTKLASVIRTLAPKFPKIRVVGLSGNHGRLDSKMSWFCPTENFDFLIYKFLENTFSESKHIKFHIPESWFAEEVIKGWKFLLSHGEDIKSFMQIPFYGAGRAAGNYQGIMWTLQRFLKTNNVKPTEDQGMFDYAVFGHHHTAANWEQSSAGAEIIMNGTFVPLSEYGGKKINKIAKPQQLLGFVHPEHGLVARYPIYLIGVK